ncbi:MAG: transporter permease [Thermomicrobiales bacterium]|nr:transporter permease [Thermomicrobiales bacterium]
MAVIPSTPRPRALRQFRLDPVWITFAVLLIIWVFSLIRVEGYRSLDFNLFTLRVAAFLGIVAAGQTLVVLMGGIDLSVAAVVTMAGVIGGHLITQIGEAAGIVLTLLIAALVGVINGLGVVALRLPPLVMTLASLSVIQGVLLVYNAGKPQIATYALCSLFAGITGLLILGRTGYSSKTAGDPYLLMSIAAVVIGGTSILGGRGKFIGTIGGALVLTVLINLLTVENISEAGRMMIQGALILILLIAYARADQ